MPSDPPPGPEARADRFAPADVLLLYADAADPVTRTLISNDAVLGWPVTALSLEQLMSDVRFASAGWEIGTRKIDPSRTAVVNRLPITDPPVLGPPGANSVGKQALWSRLRRELGRFAYASGRPTATSLIGCFGSLLDQWCDMPRLVPNLNVPEHSTVSTPRELHGEVFSVNRWALYSLGEPRGRGAALPAALRLEYVRPSGRLVTLVQVGGTMFFVNPPPEMSHGQQAHIVAFARALAAVSPLRILEHVFFLGEEAPVLYSSCPVPVIGGTHPAYPQLVIQGLRHDIEKRGGQAGT